MMENLRNIPTEVAGREIRDFTVAARLLRHKAKTWEDLFGLLRALKTGEERERRKR